MILIIIFALISAITAFTLTRHTYVKIKKNDVWRVELHFTLSAIHLEKTIVGKTDSDSKRTKKKKRRSASYYRAVFRRINELFEVAEVEINKLSVPSEDREDFDSRTMTRPWRYHTAISALLAYLRTKSEKLTVDDNAIILNPDTDRFSIDMTVKVRLYHLVRMYFSLRYGKDRLIRNGE